MKGQKVLFSRHSDEWETPQELFDELDDEFDFTLDVCATSKNAKCKKFFTAKEDGLKQSWNGICFMNPPYSNVKGWVNKAWDETSEFDSDCLVVMLLPARTDTRWFHEFIWRTYQPYPDIEVRFLKGRLKFSNSKNSAPFPSMVVIFR